MAIDKKLYALAELIRQRIEALPDGEGEDHPASKVPGVFAEVRKQKRLKTPAQLWALFDAFNVLDSRPGSFAEYPRGRWHSILRTCRNSPEWGTQLFATWKAD